MRLLTKLILSLSLLLLSNSQALSFSITPMFLDMSPAGSRARSTVTVRNTSPRAMPVRASVAELFLDANGKSSAKTNNSAFVIFPPQAVIKPYSKQAFRIQWRGNPGLSKGQTYELNIAQILAEDNRPDKNNNDGRKIKLKLAMAFGAIITMNAASGEPKPVVKSSRLSRDRKGKLLLETVLSNNSHQNFMLVKADSTVTVFDSNNKLLWSRIYRPSDMLRIFGLGVVQPYKSRRMKIPLTDLPENIARQARSVRLEIRPSEN